MDSWTDRIGSSRLSGPVTSPPLGVVDVRNRLQLRGFLFGRRVVQKISTTDLRAREILEESGFAQRRVGIDGKNENGGWFVFVGLVPHPQAGERHTAADGLADTGLAEPHPQMVQR